MKSIDQEKATHQATGIQPDNRQLKGFAESSAKDNPDARTDLFGQPQPGCQQSARPNPCIPQPDLIKAAVDYCIEANDPSGAIAIARYVALLPVTDQTLIKKKIHFYFRRSYRAFVHRLGAERAESQEPDPTEPNLLHFALTDSGNGERAALLYRDRLRWCTEMECWLLWDGQRWKVDDQQGATQLMKEMARLLDRQAIESQFDFAGFARFSESVVGINRALKRASAETGMAIRAAELDRHPHLLNCPNGMVDLRTGRLSPHDPNYFISKLCHVEFDPKAKCPRFLEFLNWAMGGSRDAQATKQLVSFFQRALGYALTGDVNERAVFILWGRQGHNGKTTLLTTIRHILAEYSAQISIDTLMTTKTQDAALRADLADLRGARFVTTSEVEGEHWLSVAKLKYITAGTDARIKTCRKYENPIEFLPTHKLFLECNHRPVVRGVDEAIWRRLRTIPFTVSIEETDPKYDRKLIEKLKAESEGVLAWLVRGAVDWYKNGLGDVPEIVEARADWRERDDPTQKFVEERCRTGKGLWTLRSALTAAYNWHCRQTEERSPLGREHLAAWLRAKGYGESRSRRDKTGRQLRTWESISPTEETLKQMTSDGVPVDGPLSGD